MITLLGAVREEIIDLRKRMVVEGTVSHDGWRLFHGQYANKAVVLAHTGVGGAKAKAVARFILEHYPVTVLISFGFAGALSQELRAGDLVLCSRLYCEDDLSARGTCLSSTPRLLLLAARAGKDRGIGFHVGSGVTVRKLVTEPEEKQALGERFRAKAVEMESYWVARLASSWGIPFLAVRAISDPLTQSLPPLDRFLDANGEWLWGKAVRHFLASPRDMAKLPEMYIGVRRARRSLICFFEAFIPLL